MKFLQGSVSRTAQSRPRPEYSVTLTLTVTDPQLLWDAASCKLRSVPGMMLDDIVDVIGPREDPAVADCVAALSAPTAMPGCALEDFSVEGMADCALHSNAAKVVQTPAPVRAETIIPKLSKVQLVLLKLTAKHDTSEVPSNRNRPLPGVPKLPRNLPVI